MLRNGSSLPLLLALGSLVACSTQPPVEKPPLPPGAIRTELSNDRNANQCNWLVDRLEGTRLSERETLSALTELGSLARSTERTRALEKCLRRRAHPLLLSSLTQSASSDELREAAARALSPLATSNDTSVLLADARAGHRQSLLVFHELHDPKALNTLTSVVRSGDPKTAEVAAQALGNYPEESSRETLVELTKGTSEPPVLVVSLASLARIGHPDDYWRVEDADERLPHLVPSWYRRQPPPILIKTRSIGTGAKTQAELTIEEKIDMSLSRFQQRARLQLRRLESVAGPCPLAFADGFESGDSGAWSVNHPGNGD